MSKKHKNIAVLMTALDSDVQAEILKGIEDWGKTRGCNITVFLWFTGAYEKDKHNLGELNIINLPDLNLFDGVILFANVLHMENNRKKLERLIEKLTCPVVCIGAKMDHCYYINSDTYTAMRQLVEHFVKDHGVRKIHFVKGVSGNVDAEARFRAYVDVLSENGIPVIPERISQGDFYVTGGELAAKEILSSKQSFPEAIICANDIMAITISDILKEKGYRIPEDVMISGYDFSIEGQNCVPRLTTVRCRFKELGSEACRVLLEVLQGADLPKEFLLADEVVLDESCGCRKELPNLCKDSRSTDVFQRKIIHQMIELEKDIMAGDGYDDWLESLKSFISQIDPPEFYCCVNENFRESVFEQGSIEQERMSQEERLEYSPKIQVTLAYQNGVFKHKNAFESKYAFDDLFQDTEQVKTYIFSPLHYLDRNYGYLVFVDSQFPIANQLYISWLINMGDSIENIRQKNLLRNAMKRLDEMYIRDSLTGVYNRFGMERFFGSIKQKCLVSNIDMQVSFVDVDGLKMINDKFGHDEGDRIINATAEALQKHAGKYYVIRYGGDEFIVMGTVHSSDEVETYWENVKKEVEDYNANRRKQAELSFSYGYDVFHIDPKTYLDDCIRITDNKMYMDKNRKKIKMDSEK